MRKPSPSMIVALLALFVALSGVGMAANGGTFILGHTNSASNSTSLSAPVAGGKALQVTNNNTSNAASTALGLNVASGHAPFTVNSSFKVANLNADMLDGIDSKAFATKAQEAWHEVGTAGQPPFETGYSGESEWADWADGYNTVAFYKDSVGQVHLKGLVKSLSGSIAGFACDAAPYQDIFQLPVGYRPAATAVFPTLWGASVSVGRIDILNTGWVSLCGPSHWDVGEYFSLDGISFRAEQ